MPVSASRVLGLKAFTTTPGVLLIFLMIKRATGHRKKHYDTCGRKFTNKNLKDLIQLQILPDKIHDESVL